jgi:probable addiction module antidote protein
MPSNIGKTTKREVTKKSQPRSASHTESTLAWLKRDPKHAAALIEVALETGDAGDFMAALRLVTEARGGVTKIADETGLNRETLYRTLSKKGNPQLSSLLPILQAAGLKLTVRAV